MSCSGSDHKMIEYLNPLQLFRESKKRYYYNPVFLAFSFRDEYADVAISESSLCLSCPHSQYPRDDTLLDNLVDVIRSVQNGSVEKYDLLGIVVAYNNHVESIHNLMGNLYKRGNFESLKYTCWKDDITSENSTWDRSPFGCLFWRRIISPAECKPKRSEVVFAANRMLETFQEFFGALCTDEFVEMEDGDKEREDNGEDPKGYVAGFGPGTGIADQGRSDPVLTPHHRRRRTRWS